ncbi:MAG: hypothetical protein HFE63_08305 [Clostridiales bacterium]|nr:hypothetical protein [Clostridiales bacterium]
MMENNIIFQDFLGIGLQKGEIQQKYPYFCTPVGAKIIAALGVDGIHYCYIPEYGEIVFVVIPMPMDDDHIHPIANNFNEFIGLILSLHGA